MGVPSMFRWLSQKYPKIISRVIEELPQEIDGVEIPVDYTKPNPNGEVDNLYLDMNGIVHPCSHPEDKDPPENEEEMMQAVFEYTDRVVRMVRPRKLLVMAVDGVAPRAKMNQQRQRRFRSVKEAQDKIKDQAELDKLVKAQVWKGKHVEEESTSSTGEETAKPKTVWDSNVITPGTPFMHLLAQCLEWWALYKLNTDPMWAQVKVLISDASVPGEGEHKIMNFIRSQRMSDGHDPNTKHVIYGLDADLIMLGLATHEPYFRVLREDVFFNSKLTCRKCNGPGHKSHECPGPDGAGNNIQELIKHNLKPYMWLHVSVLREYLDVEMTSPGLLKHDLERAIDDWVFMCFFVGNDFLPHLPSLQIMEGGIDKLIDAWRNVVAVNKLYVTFNGKLNIAAVKQLMAYLAKQEGQIFIDRNNNDKRWKARNANREDNRANGTKGSAKAKALKRAHEETEGAPVKRIKENTDTYKDVIFFDPKDAQSNEVRNAHLNPLARNRAAAAAIKNGTYTPPVQSATPSAPPAQDDALSSPEKAKEDEDTVRLWETGYADRYYAQKFGKDPSDLAFRAKVAEDYVQGLQWVLKYYLQGCPSWTWYYPHHYAPFAADFSGVDHDQVRQKRFSPGEPFKPYQQLMGVLPAASRHAVPEVYHSLMTDPDSKIRHFYPEEFVVDLNGAKQAWKGVALLPWIDEELLKSEMANRDDLLTIEEQQRNKRGNEILLFSAKHPLYANVIKELYDTDGQVLPLEKSVSGDLFGFVCPDDAFVPRSVLECPLKNTKVPNPDIPDQQTMKVIYHMPFVKLLKSANVADIDSPSTKHYLVPNPIKPVHSSKLLDGLRLPPLMLRDEDTRRLIYQIRNTYRGPPPPPDMPDSLRRVWGSFRSDRKHELRSNAYPPNWADLQKKAAEAGIPARPPVALPGEFRNEDHYPHLHNYDHREPMPEGWEITNPKNLSRPANRPVPVGPNDVERVVDERRRRYVDQDGETERRQGRRGASGPNWRNDREDNHYRPNPRRYGHEDGGDWRRGDRPRGDYHGPNRR